MFTLILITFGSLFIYLWYLVHRKYSYLRDRHINHFKPKFPWGNIKYSSSICEMFGLGYDEYLQFRNRDVMCGLYFCLRPTLVITDLDVIQDILVKDFNKFPDHNKFVRDDNKRGDPLAPSLYSLQGEMWRHMRRKMSTPYSLASIDAMFATTQFCATNLKELIERNIEQGNPCINAQDISLRYLCDAIGSCGFGIDCRGTIDEDPVLLKLAHRLFNPASFWVMVFNLTYPLVSNYWPSLYMTKHHYEFMKIINEIVKYRTENNVQRNDIFQVWLDVTRRGSVVDDESGERVELSQPNGIHAESFLLFLFSYYSTRSVLSSALHELAANQYIQTKARNEMERVLSEHGTLDYAALEKMVYLQQIVDGGCVFIFEDIWN